MKIKINKSFLLLYLDLKKKKTGGKKSRCLHYFLYTFGRGKWVKQTVHNRDKVRKYRPEISKVHENS